MAFILGRKTLKDSEEFDSYAYGITLPIQNGNTGFFSQAFTSLDQAKANLENLLLTAKGERIMQPEFGSVLGHYYSNKWMIVNLKKTSKRLF